VVVDTFATTGPVAGAGRVSGTGGTIAKFTGTGASTTISDSLITDSGTLVTVGGPLTVTGLLVAGSGLTTLTDAAGKVLAAALNTVGVAQGGSGQTSYTDGQILIGNTTGNTLAKGAITGQANGLTVTLGGGTIALTLVAANTTITSLTVPSITPTGGTLTVTGILSTTGLVDVGALTVNGIAAIGGATVANVALSVEGTIPKQTALSSFGVSITAQVTPDSAHSAYGAYVNQVIDATGLTATNYYGIYVDTGSKLAGTVTNAFGLYANAPTLSASTALAAAFNGAVRMDGSGSHLTWNTDNASDVGASGANRPRDLFLARNAVIGGTATATSLTLGSGQAIDKHLRATASWTPGTIVNLAGVTTAVTVTGAALGDNPFASFSLALPAGCFVFAAVTATNTVTVTIMNFSGSSQTVGAGTARVDLL